MIDEADIAGISSADEGKAVALSLLNERKTMSLAMGLMADDMEELSDGEEIDPQFYIDEAREILLGDA